MEAGDGAAGRDPASLVLSGQKGIAAWQEDLYRAFHQHPELGHQEVETSATAARLLTGFGFGVRESRLHRPRWHPEQWGRPDCVVRADMDALPMAEDTGLDLCQHRHRDRRRRKTPSPLPTPADMTCTSRASWVLHGCWQPNAAAWEGSFPWHSS